MNGVLYIAATPIGNMGDVTFRVIEMLQSCDVIACEDTRQAMKLLSRYEISSKRLISYHEHNKRSSGENIIKLLESGLNVILVSDAGMPAISDPGYDIVKKAIDCGFDVKVLPGASASLSALAMSGLPTERFIFEGFLPKDSKSLSSRISSIMSNDATSIVYCSPHSLCSTLRLLSAEDGSRRAAAAHELTKLHESVHRGTLSELSEYFEDTPPRGEYVLVIDRAPAAKNSAALNEMEQKAHLLLSNGFSLKDTAKLLCILYKAKRNEAYSVSETIKKSMENENG